MPPRPLKNTFPNPPAQEEIYDFCAAGKAGDIETLGKMLDKFGSRIINERDSGGDTAMTWAAWMGKQDAVKYLLDRGAAVDAPGMQGKTALMWAARSGKAAIIAMLLEHGADVTARDERGDDVLKICSENGQADVARQINDWIQRQQDLAAQKKREEEARAAVAERLQQLKAKAPKIRLGPPPPQR